MEQGQRAGRAAGEHPSAPPSATPRAGSRQTLLKPLCATATGLARDALLCRVGAPTPVDVPDRAGIRKLGNMHRWGMVLRSWAPLSRCLPPPLARGAAPLVDLGLRAGLAWRDSMQPGPRLSIDDDDFDAPAIDVVWHHRPADMLVSRRDAAMLRARFTSASERTGWRLSVLTDVHAGPVGHVVWRLLGQHAEIGDLFTTSPQTMTGAALRAFVAHARQHGAHHLSLRFFGDAAVEAEIGAAGFFRLTGTAWPVYLTGPADRALSDAGRWYLTGFDHAVH